MLPSPCANFSAYNNDAMKVTHVSLRPTDAANAAGRPALTPELLAATGARYSRSDDGLEAILAKIDPDNPDKSVDSIFKMVDYGHQSIADMAPVALFMDGVSLLLAYLVWALCPVAGGQESSTRYIRMGAEGLVDAETLGMPDDLRGEWELAMGDAFNAYAEAVTFWEGVADANPEITRIPRKLLDDPSDKAKRTVARMRRNYAFDRARYFLPVAAKTNVMMVQSARAWVTLCQHLLSHPLPEARKLGGMVRDELALVAPRLLRHAVEKPSLVAGQVREWETWRGAGGNVHLIENELSSERPPKARLDVWEPYAGAFGQFANDLSLHDNRYAYIGETVRQTGVRFGWDAVAFAEIRDLNRHRTGTKHCPLSPVGFYFATDQLPESSSEYRTLGEMGRVLSRQAKHFLQKGREAGIYFALLGTQFPFEHTTTADKFIYEAELRTGTGSHYRYAEHLRDALALWYERYPETRGLILEGSAEPE
ncbi:MAG: FAD-dependent thymidylate synthase [Akkermansiaceae bacterium]|nr:FAD-dependent thymidylate synthase [Armatimonadota bacterium]